MTIHVYQSLYVPWGRNITIIIIITITDFAVPSSEVNKEALIGSRKDEVKKKVLEN